MRSKSIVGSLILCTIVITTSRLSPTYAQMYNLMEEVNLNTFVNCEHVEKLFNLDRSIFDLGFLLDKCWHQGTTLDEINSGLTSVSERPDIQNYEFEDLYLPCNDVFQTNMTKLTTRLLEDFINCRDAAILDARIRKAVEDRFGDIVDVYQYGNLSVTIDEDTLVSCANFSKKLSLLCRQYGLTEEQWQKGFLRYNFMDKWAVEEDVFDMSIPCNEIFKYKFYASVIENPTEMFVRCQRSMPIEPEVRDIFEKKHAEQLKKIRAQESPDEPGVDLRGFVSCRHLQPVLINGNHVSASRRASDTCRRLGLTYEELKNATKPRSVVEEPENRDLDDLYLECDDVFAKDLRSFTTGLLNDYESCRAVGKVSLEGRRALWRKFSEIFELFATKRAMKRAKVPEQLVRCTDFKEELEDLCRLRGSTLTQELGGFGSLARNFGDKWLNTEELKNLYVHCQDLLEERYERFTRNIPIDRYMQCKWDEGIEEKSKALIDKRIAKVYRNNHRGNDTRYRGDADVEISSVILFE